jgi:hypothetical protein
MNPAPGEIMAYTNIQTLRKMRARNKGMNKRLAASLRDTQWLGRKGPEEFSRREIKDLQLLGKMLSLRLYANALTKAHHDLLSNPEKYWVAGGGYSTTLNPKDLLLIAGVPQPLNPRITPR